MKAAVLTAPERLELQEVPTPVAGDGEVLVALEYCGICTLEQRLFTGAMKMPLPLIPGHEASGLVASVGRGLFGSLPAGTPVALDLVTRCGECHFCRTGQSNLCVNRFQNGRKVLGGFAEYIAVSAKQVFPLPAGLPLAEAAFAEPVACCIRSLKKAGLGLAEDLLVIGAGPMGLMHLLVAHCYGARVFVSDPDPTRRAKALELGAYLSLDPMSEDLPKAVKEHTEGRGADACVVTSPAHEALKSAVDSVSKNGRINIYTSYNDRPTLPVDANTVHREQTLITGSEGRTEHDFLQAVRLLAFGKVKVAPLISAYTSLARIAEGLRSAMSPANYRVLLEHKAE
jgi:2-desacetyl-2-hydroxyethyl bacteriochlorophyllide A dehydrogenase